MIINKHENKSQKLKKGCFAVIVLDFDRASTHVVSSLWNLLILSSENTGEAAGFFFVFCCCSHPKFVCIINQFVSASEQLMQLWRKSKPLCAWFCNNCSYCQGSLHLFQVHFCIMCLAFQKVPHCIRELLLVSFSFHIAEENFFQGCLSKIGLLFQHD